MEWTLIAGIIVAILFVIAEVAKESSQKREEAIGKWRQLEESMSMERVRTILGEPDRVETKGSKSVWRYGNAGKVVFKKGWVKKWTEPG